MDTAAIAKPNFVFRRVCIGVNPGRVHRQIEHVGRESTMKQHIAIRMTYRMCKRLVINTATVDEPVLHIWLAAIKRWQTDPAVQRNALYLPLKENTLLGERTAADLGDALTLVFDGFRGRCLQYRALVVGQRKTDFRSRQCQSPEPLFDVTEFRSFRPQKTPTRRRVIEKVVDLDSGPRRVRGRHRLANRPAVCFDQPGGIVTSAP